jgi:hypothetical protein
VIVAVGVDLGASLLDAVVVAGTAGSRLQVERRETLDASHVDGLVALAAGADAVAVDAPAAPSTAVHRDDTTISPKFRIARCGEIALGEQARIWVPWVTPVDPDAVPGWMQVGFAVWDALIAAGHAPLEVYPAGVFRVLAGRVPPRKTTPAGRAARIELLAPAVELPDDIAGWSHDGIDALAAALTAHRQATGAATAHGHPAPGCDGSAIWLPSVPLPAPGAG